MQRFRHPTRQSNEKSREKRNLGFVKLRRGLREHLHKSRMSSNAATLFVWLLLSARHSGPDRGCVEANYEDIMRGLGWNRKLVQRGIRELAGSGYIHVTPAANQHGVTIIRILKFDTESGESAEDTGVPTNNLAGDTAEDIAQVEFVPSSVLSRPSMSLESKDLQAPKNAVEVKKEKNERLDAVRRPFDAEHRLISGFSPLRRREKLAARLREQVRKNGSEFDGQLDDEELAAFAATGYSPVTPEKLPGGFVYAVWFIWDQHEAACLPPGILCSKIIDYCVREQESCKTLGMDPSEYFWPPDFQDHRGRLREKERQQEAMSKAAGARG